MSTEHDRATTARRHGTAARPRISRAALLLPLAFLLGAGCGAPGEDGAEAGVEEAPEMSATDSAGPGAAAQNQMALMGELQTIQQALGPIRERAMQDPELQEQQQALIDRVETEMERIDPGSADEQARFDSLRTEFGAARQAGDQERVQALGSELQTLQGSLQQTQSEVLQQEEIAAAVEEFRENLREEMRATDPRADSLLNRADELSEELEAAMGDASGDG